MRFKRWLILTGHTARWRLPNFGLIAIAGALVCSGAHIVGYWVPHVWEARWLLGATASGAVVFTGQLVGFIDDRVGPRRWQSEIRNLNLYGLLDHAHRDRLMGWGWVRTPRPANARLTDGEFDERDPRIPRRWYIVGLPFPLLTTFLHAGLTDEDLHTYLVAPTGSQTREQYEFLASLAVGPQTPLSPL
jgi:hypothetical protein